MSKRTMIFTLFFAVLLLITACGNLQTGDQKTGVTAEKQPELPFGYVLQEILDDTMAQFDAGKGVSAALIVPGYQTWVGVSGISHDDTWITPDTVFDAGSTHKNFTASAVLLLANEGILALDDPINKWLLEYPNIDGEITIRQLLNHTGGVFDMVRHPDYWEAIMSDTTHVWAREEILNTFLLEPYFSRGEGWHYSTPGYILLRMIIEEAAGENLAAIYHTYLWDDLALENTYLATYEDLPEDTAHGWFDLNGDGVYDELPSSISFNSSTGGAVFTTAEDLAIWANALYHEKSVLSEDLLNQMLTFEATSPEEPLLVGYGLGVANYSPEIFNGMEIYGHSGSAAGNVAASLYLPEYGISLGIMFNTHDGPMLVINDLLTTVTDNLDNNHLGRVATMDKVIIGGISLLIAVVVVIGFVIWKRRNTMTPNVNYKKIRIGMLIPLLLLLTGCFGRPASSELSPEDKINKVENSLLLNQSIYERMERHSVPGVSIAVINDFEIEWAKGYGVMELGSTDPVTPDTLFQAGSVAKPVTAITALHYVERGLLDLDENVNRRLVSWQIPENEYTAQGDVTLRRLLSHTAGINQGLNAGYAPDEEVPTLEQALEGEPPANSLPVRVDRVPGTESYYSNGGYLVVVQLLEDVIGKPFTEITRETIFEPLGMTSSTYQQTLPEEWAARIATPHGWDVVEWGESPGLIAEVHTHDPGYGGLWTTAPDLARLGVEIMQTYQGESMEILTQEMVHQMQVPIAYDVPMQAPFNVDQGLGFDLLHFGGDTWFIHFGGSFPGYISVLLLQPESGFGVAILTNSFTGYELIWEIFYSLFFVYGILPTTGQLLGIGYSLLLVAASILFWRKSTTQQTEGSAARIATFLLILAVISILVVILRYWSPLGGYQVHPLWKGESVLNKALLGIFFSTPIFLIIVAGQVWRKKCWSIRYRVIFTSLLLGTLFGFYLLRDLWPLMFWG